MNTYFITLRSASFIGRLFLRLKFEGTENIPDEGGYIVCSNHRSVIDPFLLAIPFRKQIHYMAKSELFEQHGRFAAWFLHKLGSFPIQRGKGDTSSIRIAMQTIKQGGILGIFPQGHCMPENVPFQAKAGATFIASKTHASILPACIYCEGKVYRPFKRITVRFGKIIPYEDLYISDNSLSAIRAGAELVADHINQLLEERH